MGTPSGGNSRNPDLYSESPKWKWVNDRIVPTKGSAIVLIRQRAASVLWVPTLLTPRTEPLGHRGGPTPIRKKALEKGSVNRGRERRGVNDLSNEVRKFLTQARADYLSGIPEGELRRISCKIEIGIPGSAAAEKKRSTWPTRKLRRTCKPVAEQLAASR